MKQRDRDVVLLYGMQGSGKSTLAKELIEELSEYYERTIIFDLQGEYEYDVEAKTAEELEEILSNNLQEKRIGIQITDFDEAERIFQFVFIYLPNTLLVIDEAEVYLDKFTTAKKSFFHKIVSFGRHDNLGLIAIGRRPVELNPYLRAARTSVITFCLNETSDVDRMIRYGFSETELHTLTKEKHNFLVLGDTFETTERKQKQ